MAVRLACFDCCTFVSYFTLYDSKTSVDLMPYICLLYYNIYMTAEDLGELTAIYLPPSGMAVRLGWAASLTFVS